MSKKSKIASKDKRLAKKRAIKLANKAKYESWAKSGENTKSKRNRSSSRKNRLAKAFSHKTGHCGNLACKRCYP